MATPLAGTLTELTSNATIATASGGSLTAGSGYFWVQKFNRVGYNKLSDGAASPTENGFPLTWTANQKITFSFASTSVGAGEDCFGFAIAFSATDDSSNAQLIAIVRSRGTATIGTANYPGQGAALPFPISFELTSDEHIAVGQIVANSAALPSSPVNGNVRYLTDPGEYWRYDDQAESGNLSSGGGYWVDHLTGFFQYVSDLAQAAIADTQVQGARRPLNNIGTGIQTNVILTPPSYPFDGSSQEYPTIFNVTGFVPQGSRIEVIFKVNGTNWSEAFTGQASATLLGKASLTDGSLTTTHDGVGTPVTLSTSALGIGVLETPEDLDEGFAWVYEIKLQADSSAVGTAGRPLNEGDSLTYYPFVVGRLGERAPWSDSTGAGVSQILGKRLVLPSTGTGKAKMISGSVTIVDSETDVGHQAKSTSTDQIIGIASSTDDQRVVINGAFNDIAVRATAGEILTYEGQRAAVGTGLGPDSGYYTPTAFSSAVAIAGNSETLRVVVTHPTAIRSDYPDSQIRGNTNGDFNINEVVVFIRYSGTIYERTYARGSSPQTINITSLGSTTRGSLPDSSSEPSFGLWGYSTITQTAETAGSSLAAGNYEVSVGWKYNGGQVTSIDHSEAGGALRLLPTGSSLAYLDQVQEFTKAQRSSVEALSISSGLVNIDCELSNTYTLSLNADVTSITTTNLTAGVNFDIRFAQDGTGGRSLSGWASEFKFPKDVIPTMPSGANEHMVVSLKSFDGTTLDSVAVSFD